MPQQTIFIVGAQTVRGLGCSQSSELLAAVLTACFVASFIIQILVHICGYIYGGGVPTYMYMLAPVEIHFMWAPISYMIA